MQFALTEDQMMLAEGTKSFLSAKASLTIVREIATGDVGAEADLRRQVTEMGLSGVLGHAENGGLGLGLVEAVLIQEQLGYAVTPSDALTAAIATLALQSSKDEQFAMMIADISAGETRVAIALTESVSKRDGAGVQSSEKGLNGTALFCIGPADADLIIVADIDGTVHLVKNDPSQVTVEGMSTIDRTRDVLKLSFKDTQSDQLVDVNASDLLRIARLLVAADTLGTAQCMIDKAVAYAMERKQFGRTIGSFQAVKHMCAEMVAKLEPGRALMWHAAHLVDTDDSEAPLVASLAASYMAEASRFIARTSTEVHGGMGFTDLLGLHYWFKRIGLNNQMFGGATAARADAAKLQGWI